MNLLEGLNEPQQQAVTHTDGPLLIFAGAGSGKTRTLTHRIANLIQHHNVPPARILAVTFTNKAAKEMRARLDALVGASSHRIWMGTFHAMCAQMLRINGGLIGIDPRFVIFDSDDSARLMRQILKEAAVDSERFAPNRVLGRISEAKNKLQTPDEFAIAAISPNDRVVARLYKHYQERLRAASALDFDDLLGECVRLLRDSREAHDYWSDRFLHVLIDEFQDVNAAQFKWAQLLAQKHRNICVVGDDDQCVAKGSLIQTPDGPKRVEDIAEGDAIIGAAGRGTTAVAKVEKVRARPYRGTMLRVSTKSNRVLEMTPNHMCFARLGVRPDVFYVYLMFRRDKGFRLGVAVGARSDGRREELLNGLQVRANQEGADKMWVLRVCHSRAEACFHEQLWAFQYGIPTTVFSVAGRGAMQISQAQVDAIYSQIDTRARAEKLMDEMGLDFAHPHHRPSGLTSATREARVLVHLTAFGGNAPSVQSPWFRHRAWLNTSNRVLETQLQKSGIDTRAGNRQTWRVERSYAELDRTAQFAETMARAAGEVEVARWAALSVGTKFAFQPASHLRPTMIVPIYNDGRIEEDEIVSVEPFEYSNLVYDLNVRDLRNFVANGIVTHNSIYAWRGANVRIILDFELDYPDARVIRLEQNYRSTQNILDAAHGVISKNLGRKPKKLWTAFDGGEKIQVHGTSNAQEEAAWVVRQIQQMQRERKGSPGDFALLCRVNAQSRPFEEAFMRARLPLRLVGTQRFYDRKEIKDLISYLKVLYNPRDDVSLGRIINVPARAIGDATVEKLQILAEQSGVSLLETILDAQSSTRLGRVVENKIAPFRGLMQALQNDATETKSVADLLSLVIERTDYLEHLRRDKTLDSVDRLANVQELLRAAEDFDKRMHEESLLPPQENSDEFGDAAHDDNRSPLGFFLESSALEGGQDAGATGEAVTLMTLHSAKGLEFPVVFLVGMEQGLLPHARALWGEGAGGDELEEERRLCYVGLTRARETLILTYATQRTLHGRTEITTPSQFLDEIPATLLQRSGYGSSTVARRASTDWDSPSSRATSSTRNSFVPASSRANEPSKFAIGDRVKHPTFGEGLVVNASPSGGMGEWVEVAFLSADVGKKKLVIAFAPIEKM